MFKSRKNGVNRFAAATATHRQRIHIEQNSVLDSEYPFRLNFYNKPPSMDITIEEFELFALDRLQGKTTGLVWSLLLMAVDHSSQGGRNGQDTESIGRGLQEGHSACFGHVFTHEVEHGQDEPGGGTTERSYQSLCLAVGVLQKWRSTGMVLTTGTCTIQVSYPGSMLASITDCSWVDWTR